MHRITCDRVELLAVVADSIRQLGGREVSRKHRGRWPVASRLNEAERVAVAADLDVDQYRGTRDERRDERQPHDRLPRHRNSISHQPAARPDQRHVRVCSPLGGW